MRVGPPTTPPVFALRGAGQAQRDGASLQELTPEEQRVVESLKKRDREVRAHEQAHKARAGAHAQGGPVYEYERGPDNRNYAVGGHVRVDTSEVRDDPRATIAKMQQIERAALAPAEPSAQDRQVASEARQKASEARRDLMFERLKESAEPPGEPPGSRVDIRV